MQRTRLTFKLGWPLLGGALLAGAVPASGSLQSKPNIETSSLDGSRALGGDAAAAGGGDLVDAVRCSMKASCNAAMRTWLCLRTTGTST